MKNKKKLIGLVIVLVCLVLSVALILSRCASSDGEEEQTQPSSNVGDTQESTEESSELTEQTTQESTEESTEMTEETTEATEETEPEETTAPTTGGSSSPGGVGGFVGGSVGGNTDDDTQEDTPGTGTVEELKVEPAGTQTNAYTEYVSTLPDAFGSVKIPAGGTMYYNLYPTERTALTIADPDASVTLNGVTYTADENGVVTVLLAPSADGAPLAVQLGNLSGGEEAYELCFQALLGSEANPEELLNISQILVNLDENHPDGYYYTWTALENGTLTLTPGTIEPLETQYDIILTAGETTVKLSDSQEGAVSLEVREDDEVTIQVLAIPEGTESQLTITGAFAPGSGTSTNPYAESVWGLPGSFDTVEIPAGKEVYYSVYYVGGSVLTIEDPDAYVILGEEVYTADENGVVTVPIEFEDPRTPANLIVGNSGETAEAYTLTFTPPIGSSSNPLVVEDITAPVISVPEGSESGYYVQWIAPNDGILSLEAAAVPETAGFDVIVTNMNTYEMKWLSDGSPIVMEFTKDDVVLIQIALQPDENWVYPAADVTLLGTYTLIYGTANNPYTAALAELPGQVTTAEIPAGEAVYYEVSNVSGTILTIESPDAYVIYDGVTYTPDASGVLTLEVKASSSRYPVSLQIGNNGEAAQSYTLNFTPTTGSVGNPQVVYSLFKLDTSLEANEAGYYYTWTATADGAVSFWVDEEKSSKVAYDIILSSTGSYSCPALSESENGAVSMLVKEGDVVTIQVATVAESGTNPAAFLAVRGAVYTGEGTEERPYMTTVIEIPSGLATMEIVNGTEAHYSVYRIGDTILTIEDEDAYIIYDGVTYSAVDGVVSVKIPASAPMAPISLTVGNYLTEQEIKDEEEALSEAYVIKIENILGSYGNPQILTDITSFTADLEEGNEVGYYFHWTAEADGTVTFRINSITEGVTGNVVLSNLRSYENRQLTDSEEESISMDVEAGDELTILVAAMPDDSWNYPAAVIEVAGAFEPLEPEEPETEETEPETEVTEPETEVTEPETEVTEPETEVTEPETEVTEPETEVTEPETEATEPGTEVTEPETEVTEPETEVTEPETEVTEPETEVTEPETEVTEPETELTEPETELTEPETEVTEPETEVTEPETEVTEPKTETTEPVTEETEPVTEEPAGEETPEEPAEPEEEQIPEEG